LIFSCAATALSKQAQALALLRDTAWHPAEFCLALHQVHQDSFACGNHAFIAFIIDPFRVNSEQVGVEYSQLTSLEMWQTWTFWMVWSLEGFRQTDKAATSFSYALHQAVQSNEAGWQNTRAKLYEHTLPCRRSARSTCANRI
jgi:hypothetical protein